MQSSTFLEIASKIINNFETDYPTVGSLQNILKLLSTLPIEETVKYDTHISKITKLISEYGKKDVRLTDNQCSKILALLGNGIFDANNKNKNITHHNFISPLEINPSMDCDINYERAPEILDCIINLYINLRTTVMISTVTSHIVNYYDFIETGEYTSDPLVKKVNDCLFKGGWNWNKNVGPRGFFTEPNIQSIVRNMENIISKNT
jgi:hypothetical protein